MSDRSITEDLNALENALAELDQNGADADGDVVAETLPIFDDMFEQAHDSGLVEEEGYDELEEAHEAVVAVAEGEADEDDAALAYDVLAAIGMEIVQQIFGA